MVQYRVRYGYYSEGMINKVTRTVIFKCLQILKIREECIRWKKEESISTLSKNQIEFLYVSSMYSILENYKSFRFNTADELSKNTLSRAV
jgi:hypothetical protein